MSTVRLTGMTWEHRRAVDPILAASAAFSQQNPDIQLDWDARPLSGFEFTSVDMLAQDYDLIILDHPFMGAVAKSGSLMPTTKLIEGRERDFIGNSAKSYYLAGEYWAVPVDAATQVGVLRPDLASRVAAPTPRTWDELRDYAALARTQGLQLAIGLKGVHSLMTFFSLCANLGYPCGLHPAQPFCNRGAARKALGLMQRLLDDCPPEVLDWNAIDVHEQMVSRDDLVLCPAVYCYATYAQGDIPHPLRFFDFPGLNGSEGTTVGGAGLAISSSCSNSEAAMAFARFVMTREIQTMFARHHGQPAHLSVWLDPGINKEFGDCFESVRMTQESAWLRPRFSGYLGFQARAGGLIEAFLRGTGAADTLIDDLSDHFGRSAQAG